MKEIITIFGKITFAQILFLKFCISSRKSKQDGLSIKRALFRLILIYILRYTQTDTEIRLLYYKDIWKTKFKA